MKMLQIVGGEGGFFLQFATLLDTKYTLTFVKAKTKNRNSSAHHYQLLSSITCADYHHKCVYYNMRRHWTFLRWWPCLLREHYGIPLFKNSSSDTIWNWTLRSLCRNKQKKLNTLKNYELSSHQDQRYTIRATLLYYKIGLFIPSYSKKRLSFRPICFQENHTLHFKRFSSEKTSGLMRYPIFISRQQDLYYAQCFQDEKYLKNPPEKCWYFWDIFDAMSTWRYSYFSNGFAMQQSWCMQII